jgi:hypothetical protein
MQLSQRQTAAPPKNNGKSGFFRSLLGYAPPAHQIDDQHDQRNHQQQVNQPASHVETETKKPQDQKHNENSPKHFVFLLSLKVVEEQLLPKFRLTRSIEPEPAVSRIPDKTPPPGA